MKDVSEPHNSSTSDRVRELEEALKEEMEVSKARETIIRNLTSDLDLAWTVADASSPRFKEFKECLDGITSIAELLIKEGAVSGPMSLSGWCIKARKLLTKGN